MVQYSQYDKNEPPSAIVSKQPTLLYVGNLHANITAEDIQDIFGEFGEVDSVELQRDAQTGLSKGYGFVQFRNPEAAKRALVQVNGRELVGNTIKVGLVNSTSKSSGGAGDLDEEGGESLDAHSRVSLMAKLHRKDDDVTPEPTSVAETPVGMQPSNCIAIQNMYDHEEASDPNFEEELTEDVKEECSKYGEIRQIRIDKQSMLVYVRFVNIAAAQLAHPALHGRWFAGKMITCSYIPEAAYLQLWS